MIERQPGEDPYVSLIFFPDFPDLVEYTIFFSKKKFPISTALDYSKALGPLDLCLIKNIEPALDGLIQ